MSIQESLKIVPHKISSGEVAVLEFDLVGEKANKFSTPVMLHFQKLIDQLRTSSYKALIIISKKPKIFIAGADIDEIKAMTTKEEFERAVGGGQNVFNALEDLPMPTIAAIHGACMGGGTEMILACDYRIASEDSATRIGLPETQLGIIPGFGGCVRLPRLVGLQASLDIILAGKSVNAKKAQKMGLVDDVVHQNLLLEFALKTAEKMAASKKPQTKIYQPKSVMDKILNSVENLWFSAPPAKG